MAVERKAILSLYRNLIRESKKWHSYNYRNFALRKVRHEFQEKKSLKDESSVVESYNRGLENLEIIKRQVTIGNLYSSKPLVIEKQISSPGLVDINVIKQEEKKI